jgi:hypothetical protein
VTQPPNAPGPYGPQNSGWQQQPNPNYAPGPVAPGPGGPGYGGRPPRRTGLYVVIAVVVVLVLGAGVLVATISGGDDNRSGPTQPSTAPPPPTASSEPNPLPSSTATSSEPSAPRLTEATALATRFLAYVNAADQKHALALGCADSRNILAGLLVFMIDPPTKLTVSGQPVATQTYYRKISVPYSGTTKGPVPRTGTVDIMDQPSTPLCVRLTTMR